ncbi:MAG: nucleotidyl transferase AbiEii/AbiGii toxin family protein, partial [Deltaproteobacteria bacterium]|nr:nucleotidyl transferase AbiEii/AbiGii toxin family protein [Deltaproteobacteria bacterium]
RGIFNTRPRDFYDIYILATTQNFNAPLLLEAIEATAEHRGSTENIADKEELIGGISDSPELRRMWAKYQRRFDCRRRFL